MNREAIPIRPSAISVALLAFLCTVAAGKARGQVLPGTLPDEDRECLECHEEMDEEIEFPDGESRTLRVNLELLKASAHGRVLSCNSCHDGYDEEHSDYPEDSSREYAASLSALCENCHEETPVTGMPKAGLGCDDCHLCTDCHSAHADGPPAEAASQISRRCGACHEGELAAFETGGHAEGIASGSRNPDLPHCATCHLPHRPTDQVALGARLETTALCIECHSREVLIRKYDLPGAATRSYEEDFHGLTFQHIWAQPEGKVDPSIMICADCHGPHKAASLSPDDLTRVCAECHPDADRKFAGAWLGHEAASPTHSTLVWLVRGLYYVCIPFVVIGLLLNILLHGRYRYRKNPIPDRWARPGSNGGPPKAKEPSGLPSSVVRFQPVERVEHLLGMLLFAVLVFTGLPQSYPQASLGQWFIGVWGGIESTRWIHRSAGFCFAALAVLHVTRGILGAVRKNRIPTMVFRRQDFRDAYATLRFYLGKGRRPKFGRFDYRQKFEYWGLFLGGTLMTLTGVMLVFPEMASHFLPGVFIAAARVAHGLEATLAVLVVVIWHFYEVLLRPEIFPGDTSIFTGKISVDRLQEEHELEFERLVGKHSWKE